MRVVCRVGSGNSAAASRYSQAHGSRFGSHARLRGEAQKRQSLCIFPEERFVVHARRGQACIERLVQARVADLSAGACGKASLKVRACSAVLPGRKFFRIAYGSKAPGIAASATWSLQARSGI